MKHLKLIKWSVVESVKSSVQKRGSYDNAGFISKKWIPHYFVILSWVFSQDRKTSLELSKRILKLWDKNGSTFLVKYLKESYLITQKFVSGIRVEQQNVLPLNLKGGLPRIIPGSLRNEIRKGNPNVIRMVLTSLAVFRIIKCDSQLKLSTITDPFKGISEILPDYEVAISLRSLFGPVKDIKSLSQPKWLFLMTAGPNSSLSWKGTWLDIKAWSESGNFNNLIEFIQAYYGVTSDFLFQLLMENSRLMKYQSDKPLVLGRLSLKEEAAGKIRVFAITDSVSQAVLKPIHKFIFGLLKNIPQDGTFDQVLPLKHLLDMKFKGELGSSLFHSYDLSAATDRLPLKFQEQCLSLLFGNSKLGYLWGQLLNDRDWSLKGTNYRYSVGQPMGALSSWAMLALSHHVIVQIAAQRVGFKSFKAYALLGDDIVIANDAVAASYYSLMVNTLGVDINLSKSLVSPTHFEYAKRLVSVEHELTPIGPKNILILLRSPTGIVSVLRDAVLKGYSLNESSVTTLISKFPIFRKRSTSKLQWLLKGPFGLVPTESSLSSQMRLDMTLTSVAFDLMISAINHVLFIDNEKKWFKNLQSYNNTVRSWEHLKETPFITGCSIFESQIFFPMREVLMKVNISIMEDKPVKRLIFNGPLIHFGFYAEGWKETVMKYISSLIHSSEVVLPTTDPFKDLSLSIPIRETSRAEKFFRDVRKDWVERMKVPRSSF